MIIYISRRQAAIKSIWQWWYNKILSWC